MSTNNTLQIGNLVRNPVVRTTQNGTRVGEITIAVNNEYKKDDAVFFKVTLWGKHVDFAEKWLSKGDKVSVSGQSLNAEGWIDKNSGEVRTVNVINASSLSGLVVKKFQERRETENDANSETPTPPANTVPDNPNF